jgi:hypothetical protein
MRSRHDPLVCAAEGSGGAAPNNGMHPTADTPPVMLSESCGAAGDAGR